MDQETMINEMTALRSEIKEYAIMALRKRFEKVQNRNFVLFPVLRARLLLMRLAYFVKH